MKSCLGMMSALFPVLCSNVCVCIPLVGGDVSQETVDSAAVFLFSLFRSDPQWSRTHAEEIRRILGPYPASVATRACSIVSRILGFLPKKIDSQGDGVSGGNPHQLPTTRMRKEFGHNIAFKFEDSADNHSKAKNRTAVAKNRTGVTDDGVKSKLQGNSHSQDTGLLRPLETHGSKVSAGYDSLSDEEDGKPSLVASALLNSMKSGPPSSEVPKTKKPNGVKKMAPVVVAPYSGAWLKQQCQECTKHGLLEITWQDLYSAVFEHLSSTQDNTAIQNDVSDLVDLTPRPVLWIWE